MLLTSVIPSYLTQSSDEVVHTKIIEKHTIKKIQSKCFKNYQNIMCLGIEYRNLKSYFISPLKENFLLTRYTQHTV